MGDCAPYKYFNLEDDIISVVGEQPPDKVYGE